MRQQTSTCSLPLNSRRLKCTTRQTYFCVMSASPGFVLSHWCFGPFALGGLWVAIHLAWYGLIRVKRRNLLLTAPNHHYRGHKIILLLLASGVWRHTYTHTCTHARCWNDIVVHSEKQLAVVAGCVCCWKVPWVEIPLGLSHKEIINGKPVGINEWACGQVLLCYVSVATAEWWAHDTVNNWGCFKVAKHMNDSCVLENV